MARWRRLDDHGIQVPTMVLLSLVTADETDGRDQIRTLTRQVCQLLNDTAAGLCDGWDSDMAHQA